MLRLLLEGGLLHGDVMTVTGNTMADNLRAVAPLAADQDVIVPLAQPVAPAGCLPPRYKNSLEVAARKNS